MAVCPSCAAENEDGVKFCGECGSTLAVRCPSCGTPNGPGRKFCGECGSPLGAVPAPEPPAAEPDFAAASEGQGRELRLVSVLFADLVGFTSLSEQRDAEGV